MTSRPWPIRRGRRRRLAGTLAVTLLVALVAGTVPASAGDAPSAVSFRGVEQTPWVTRSGLWRLVLEVGGAPAGSTLTADIYERVSSREEAVAALYTAVDGERLASLPDVALDDVSAEDGRREVPLAVSLRQDGPAQTQPGWAFFSAGLRPGVYPVDVRVRDSEGVERGRIMVLLTRVPSEDEEGAGAAPLLVAPVVRLGGEPSIGPDGRAAPTPATTARATTLADGLEPLDGLPLTLIPRPESVEAMARDDVGVDALTSLEEATRTGQVVDGPYVDVPLPAWVDRGMTEELTRQRERGNSILTEHLGRIDSSTWDATEGLTTAAAAALWPVGVRTVLVGRDALGPDLGPDAGPYPVDIGSGRSVAAVRPDASASDALTRRDDPVLDTAGLAAELALLAPTEGPTRGVVVVAPEDWPADAEAVELLGEMLQDPAAPVEAVTMADLLDRTDDQPARGLAPILVPDLGAYPDRLAVARSRLASYTGMVGLGETEAGALDQRLLLSGARSFTPEEQGSYVESVLATLDERFAQIRAPGRQTYTLTSSDGSVPLTLLNELDVPARVVIELRSGTGGVEFRDGDRLERVLTPGANPLSIPVHARAPGDSSMDIVVRTPDGAIALDQVRYTVRSTAVPGLGLVLSIGAAAFLLVWWGRHWTRSRRSQRDDTGAAPDAAAGASTSEPEPASRA